ncbi:MAG: hypothetical protein RR922_06540 [Clostridia bacterium]
MKQTRISIENKPRFIAVVCICIALCMFLVFNIFKPDIFVPSSKKNAKNVKKYARNIEEQYTKDGMKEKFEKTYNALQENTSLWIFNNITTEEASFENGVAKVNKMLEEKKYEEFKMQETDIDFWVGNFSMDNSGKIIFKFASKEIVPVWVNELNAKNILVK